MPEVLCHSCGSRFVTPDDLPETVWHELVQSRGFGIISTRHTMDLLEHQPAIAPIDKKNVAHHLARPDGTCHECRHMLTANGLVICAHCGATNINY